MNNLSYKRKIKALLCTIHFLFQKCLFINLKNEKSQIPNCVGDENDDFINIFI